MPRNAHTRSWGSILRFVTVRNFAWLPWRPLLRVAGGREPRIASPRRPIPRHTAQGPAPRRPPPGPAAARAPPGAAQPSRASRERRRPDPASKAAAPRAPVCPRHPDFSLWGCLSPFPDPGGTRTEVFLEQRYCCILARSSSCLKAM
ncbi:PREDICTED: vegetative cell wall protein gp1-like [Chinchilla lanigera]|uniref:vegetative cell wall protein gp1-like n=1 Tax=Chinchilla lanigera TaxID=34839 RepID=UPI000697BD80|nr:PREDICTED: vegetative cell wall protein gp1-like [Chinchilla lanigera]